MKYKPVQAIGRLLVIASVVGATTLGFSQAASTPPPPQKDLPSEPNPSRIDLFAGYSYLAPHGSIHDSTTVPDGVYRLSSQNYGELASAAYFFNKYYGFQVEYGIHSINGQRGYGNNDGFQTAQGGIIFRFPYGDITPFIHGLAGAVRMGGPNIGPPDVQVEPYTWGPALTTGGGMDYLLPYFHHRLALRLFQADYEYFHVDYGPARSITPGGRINADSARLSTGLVFKFGSILPPPPVTLACSITPDSGYPGDSFTVTGTPGMLNPKKTPMWTWTANGGKITPNGASATVDTTGATPGSYAVQGHVSEGAHVGQSADCTANFTVKPFEPPTISCSANPSTVAPGGQSTISAMANSPQNRPLTYSYSASGGTIGGNTNTATLNTTGAAPGPITVTCNVQDDKGQTASATTTVSVENPAPPPSPHVQKLCSITFDRDKKRPARVDNEAKACLDEVALSLQQNSDAHAVVVGESSDEKKMAVKMATQRAVNTKAYLTTEKGVDASRVEVRTGPEGSKQVENYLVPAGATFDSDIQGTTAVEEGKVKAQPRGGAAHKAKHRVHATPQ